MGGAFDVTALEAKILKCDNLINRNGFWDNSETAIKVLADKKDLENKVSFYNETSKEFNNLCELLELAKAESDDEMILEVEKQLENFYKTLKITSLSYFMNDKEDKCSAFIEIHSGAGGTEACDWADMLKRMYLMWAEKHKYKIEVLEEHSGDVVGVKSTLLQINGDRVYGWLKNERGIHRLVRISPFDSNARRHTSFASVWVYPVVDNNIVINIDTKDLKIDTYRASGAGGQHVNKTDSAVRITHIPTGIVVQCQNERSQFKNKDIAMSLLKSKLYNLELEKKQKEKKKINDEKKDISWGEQIRSYVLQPYQLVKDLRSNVENTNVDAVLNGDIDCFLTEMLFK